MIFTKLVGRERFSIALILTCFTAISAQAQEWKPEAEGLSDAFRGTTFSPYADRTFPELPLWGETHLHTGLSMDAGAFGNRLGIRDAYRAARGEQVTSSNGTPFRLSRPFDWVVIADHSDGLGMIDDMVAGAPSVTQFEQGRKWSKAVRAGGEEAVGAALDLIGNFSQGTIEPAMMEQYSPGARRYSTIWDDIILAAEENNEPGVFTALIGYEWTSLVRGGNMHRNVIFRDGADRVRQVVPFTTVPPIGSPDPLDLYAYLEAYEDRTNGSVMAISHNGNLSNGIMFPVDAQYSGRALDSFYAEQRAKWERLYEVTQIKGDGETIGILSPDDEFADFETWAVGNLDLSVAKTDDMLQYEYAREALKNGMVLEQRLGTNPYKFGQIGSTDSHTSLPSAEENNFFGKHTGYEPTKDRMSHAMMKAEFGEIAGWELSASGLTAVWSNENTRAGVFDAMDRKEVYATTGSRMVVRFFGGWDFDENDAKTREPAAIGYAKGVPMGGDLPPLTDQAKAPSFMVYALKDVIGANLDRIQIVKGWVDGDGATHEKVYDVVWSGHRKPDANGKLPPVGNTVDEASATWTNTIGRGEMGTIWTDPEFDPTQSAFYYARVLEIPTPRWILYDALRFGSVIPEDAVTVLQERAYTSPIWYTPKG
jgi:uncharacterized protein DUF3604